MRGLSATTCALAVWCIAQPAAAADDAALAACRRIDDVARRLACYDSIPIPLAAPAAAPRAAAPAPTPAPAAAAPATTAATAATTTTAPTDIANFGRAVPSAQPQTIESSVGADFDGWRRNGRITLANGQVWQVIDDSVGILQPRSRKVSVRRASFGTFFMDFEGSNTSPRVKRVD